MFDMNIFWLTLLYVAIAEVIVLPISISISKIINSSDNSVFENTPANINPDLQKDRFYFVSIYSSDVGNYYYTKTIGFSVICNLLFLLSTFLCSEGVKNYKLGYSIAFIPLGIFQLIRIISIPLDAHSKMISLDGSQIQVMDDSQFSWVCVCLVCAAIACFIAGAIGLKKTKTLKDYEKQISNN